MSKNIYKSKSYLSGLDKEILTVAFGNGEIQVGIASWPKDNQHVLIFADTETMHEINSESKTEKGKWFEEVSGDVVCLGFTNADSIDVVIHFLNEIKQQIITQKSCVVTEGER